MDSKSSWLIMAQVLGKYEWARICIMQGGLCSKLQHYGTCKFSWEESKASTSNPSSYIKDYII